MTTTLAGFARALRAAGVPCSPAEVVDAAAAVRAAGIDDRETFRLALRACVAKQADHLPIYDRLFEATFRAGWPSRPTKPTKPTGGRPGDARRPRPEAEGRGPSRRREEPQPVAGPPAAPRESARDLARRHREEVEREQRQALGRRQWETARHERDDPRRKPLWSRLDETDLRALDREAERLGRLLRTRLGRRHRRSARGGVDLRATVTRAARTGGVPFVIVRRRAVPARPRLLVLCDVSGSVRHAARLLLRLLHETHRLFGGTAGFVFVDRPVPAAPLFRHADFSDALAELDHLPGLDREALSDFGNVFVRVATDHARLLTRRTSVLILGDARCNRFDSAAWALEAIRRRVHRVVWLNPDRPERWRTGDSRLRDYEPHLDLLLPAGTVAELAEGVAQAARPARPARS